MSTRVALVTGGGMGIGAATCRLLADQGARVAIGDIDEKAAKVVAGDLAGKGHAALHADVTDEASVAALFSKVESDMGPIAILVCVAGGPLITPDYRPRISQMSVDHWEKTDALNARGTFLCVREFLRLREKAPVPDGRIVALSSMAGLTAGQSETDAAYSASKAAIIGLMRNAAIQGAACGITANAIAPGLIDTPGVHYGTTQEQRDGAAKVAPLRRLGRDGEVAAMIAFLASPQASYVTGQTIGVNGGRHMN